MLFTVSSVAASAPDCKSGTTETSVVRFHPHRFIKIRQRGRVWLITPVLKTGDGKPSEGSNPSAVA